MNVSDLMREDFSSEKRTVLSESPGKHYLPVSPEKTDWTLTENPETMQRVYTFKNATTLIYFLEDIVQMQEEMHHHAKILVDHLQVLVQISTKKLERVTELDIEWTRKADEIYEDVRQEE